MSYYTSSDKPTDDQIAQYGFRAFSPRRDPFIPTAEDFERAGDQCATGDPDEYMELAEQLAATWVFSPWQYMAQIYGYDPYGDDDG